MHKESQLVLCRFLRLISVPPVALLSVMTHLHFFSEFFRCHLLLHRSWNVPVHVSLPRRGFSGFPSRESSFFGQSFDELFLRRERITSGMSHASDISTGNNKDNQFDFGEIRFPIRQFNRQPFRNRCRISYGCEPD